MDENQAASKILEGEYLITLFFLYAWYLKCLSYQQVQQEDMTEHFLK